MMQGQIRIDGISQQLQQCEGKLKKRPPLTRRQHSTRGAQGDQANVLPGLLDVPESVMRKKFANSILRDPVTEKLGQFLLVPLQVEIPRRQVDPLQNRADSGTVEVKRGTESCYGFRVVACKPQSFGQQRQLFRILRNEGTEGQPPELQPVFYDAQKPIGQGKLRLFSFQKKSGLCQTSDPFERGTDANGRVLVSRDQLQVLHVELSVPDSTGALFQVGLERVFLFRAMLDPLDFLQRGIIHLARIGVFLDEVAKAASKIAVAGDKPRLDQRLAFPGFAPRFVVTNQVGNRWYQRSRLAMRAETHIHSIKRSVGAGLRQEKNQPLSQAGKEAKLVRIIRTAPEEDQVHVGTIIELVPSKFSQREHRKALRGRAVIDACRPLTSQCQPRTPKGGRDHKVSQAGQAPDCFLEGREAGDIQERNFQILPALEGAELID